MKTLVPPDNINKNGLKKETEKRTSKIQRYGKTLLHWIPSEKTTPTMRKKVKRNKRTNNKEQIGPCKGRKTTGMTSQYYLAMISHFNAPSGETKDGAQITDDMSSRA